jgi:hypothetical protein
VVCKPIKSDFLGLNEALLGNEDTIKELTLILISDVDGLADTGAAERDGGVIEAFENEFILDINGESDGDSGNHVNVLDLLTSEEVLDINARSILGDGAVNGEMSMDGSHLVHVAFGDTDAHVLNVGLESVDGTSLLVTTEPHADSEVVSGSLFGTSSLGSLDLAVKVREVLGNLSSGSGNNDNSGLDGTGNTFGNKNPVLSQQSLHDNYKYIK